MDMLIKSEPLIRVQYPNFAEGFTYFTRVENMEFLGSSWV